MRQEIEDTREPETLEVKMICCECGDDAEWVHYCEDGEDEYYCDRDDCLASFARCRLEKL